jgi:hypothetical protein
LHFYCRLSVRLCTGVECVNAVAPSDSPGAMPAETTGNVVAYTCSPEQRRSAPARILMPCISYRSRP